MNYLNIELLCNLLDMYCNQEMWNNQSRSERIKENQSETKVVVCRLTIYDKKWRPCQDAVTGITNQSNRREALTTQAYARPNN